RGGGGRGGGGHGGGGRGGRRGGGGRGGRRGGLGGGDPGVGGLLGARVRGRAGEQHDEDQQLQDGRTAPGAAHLIVQRYFSSKLLVSWYCSSLSVCGRRS